VGESFRQVSERLEQVYSGLGEMRMLASGVGDLKRVLTNVKIRGTWGEVQLGAIIEQLLAPEQFARNVATSGTGERVEYAVKLPGRDSSEPVWLPIDAKFPMEDYLGLIEASERGDGEASEKASRQLEMTLRLCAKNLSDRYLAPPFTTDFGILFLSTEGLYAEAMRRPGFADAIQREYRVVLSGPSTLAALLNALQMGFRTLAIQKRSSEVWETLGSVKTEFSKYAQVLVIVKKKLSQAQDSIDRAETRTMAIQRTLRDVEAPDALELPHDTGIEDAEADRTAVLASAMQEE
jgi:DNA recombination protein RmuC